MNINKYLKPAKLEKYAFLWSEVRLLLAAVALFAGGIPFVFFVLPQSFAVGLFRTLLTLTWIVSGLASTYLGYAWYKGGKTLFGKKDKVDMYAFLVSVVSGINLGITGLFQTNPGMSISSSKGIFIVFGILYVASAFQLYKKWAANGKKLF